MSDVYDQSSQRSVNPATPPSNDFGVVANDLCEKALNDAREQLHPLLREVELDRLEKRSEFVQAFKSALEKKNCAKTGSLAARRGSCLQVRWDPGGKSGRLGWFPASARESAAPVRCDQTPE